MTELKKSLRQSRRTEITAAAHELTREELEAHEQVVVTLSRGGYIKRIPASTFRNQHRGGKGVTGMNTKDDDPVDHILVVDTHDALLFFTNKGRVIKITAYELRPDLSRNTRGVPVDTVMPLGPGEKVKAVIGVAGLDDDEAYLVLATRGGVIKRMALNAISNIRPSGLIIMNVKDGDELVAARLAKDDDDAIIVSEQGMSIRFTVTQIGRREEDGTIRPHSRTAGGVKGMDLRRDSRPNDRVVSMDVGRPETRLLVISELGYGKLTLLDKYRPQNRGGKGLMTFKITKKTGKVAAAQLVEDDKEVYVVSEQAQVIRTNLEEIRSIGRVTQGVSIFKPAPGDKVTSIACVSDLRAARQAEASQTRSTNGSGNGRNGSS
jgi:DNA gyrase subunit A